MLLVFIKLSAVHFIAAALPSDGVHCCGLLGYDNV